MAETDNTLYRAKQAVFRMLKIRPRSEFEVKSKLKQKRLDDEVIVKCLAYFKELGLINDADFAKKWISYRLLKPFGPARIQNELLEKGVRKDIIAKALKEAFSDFDEEKKLYDLVHRRARSYKGVDTQKVKQRLYAYLLRRGFNPQLVYKVINTYDDKRD